MPMQYSYARHGQQAVFGGAAPVRSRMCSKAPPTYACSLQGIGNGLPLAAVVTTPEIASTMAQRLHFNTFGGNPVCCAGGREVLRVIDDEGIQANAHAVRCVHTATDNPNTLIHARTALAMLCTQTLAHFTKMWLLGNLSYAP